MRHIRNMPAKKSILNYWRIEYEMELYDNVCWGCNFESTTSRCHLLAKCNGGNEDVSNLVLLCDFCHRIQENYYSNSLEDSKVFKEMIIEYAPFFNVKYEYYISLIKHGIIKNTDAFKFASLAQYERALISERASAALQAKLKREGGKWWGKSNLTAEGRAKGIETIKNKAASNENNIRARAHATELRAKGYTLQAICDSLNAGAFYTSKGGKFSPMQVSRLIK